MISDWADRDDRDGRPWWEATDGSAVAKAYARRRAKNPTGIPRDNQVVIVYTDAGIMMVHQTEIAEEMK